MKPTTRLSAATLLALVFLALVSGLAFYLHPLTVSDDLVRFNLWRHGVHSRSVNVDGYQIHYFEAPAAKGTPGTPLVLIHGLGSRGDDWAPLIPRLAAAGFHVYAPDLLGYGRSPKPDVSYSIALEEKIVVNFIAALNIPKADLGGWSMGGWIAARLTLDHPTLVNRLVLYDSAGIYFPPTFDATLFTPSTSLGLDRLAAMLTPHPHRLPQFIVRAALAKLQRNGWVIQRSVDRMLDGRDLLDFRLGDLHTPTLIIWGTKDVLIPPSVGETMYHLIPGSSLTLIDGCGHLAPSACPNSTLKATIGFLNAPTPPPPTTTNLPGN